MSDAEIATLSNDRPLVIISPQGGEGWKAGSVQDIMWVADSRIANVKLEYTIDNGVTWNEIVASTPAASGRYSWTLPDIPSKLCRVRVSDAACGGTIYETVAPFSIFTATDGLLAYYPFNGTAEDGSGNGNHGLVKLLI
jgi:hypothetical protein